MIAEKIIEKFAKEKFPKDELAQGMVAHEIQEFAVYFCKEIKQIVIEDVPYQYQSRLLEKLR